VLFSNKALEFTLELSLAIDYLLRITDTSPMVDFGLTVVGDVDLDDFEYTRFDTIGLVSNFQRFEKRPAKLHNLAAPRVVFARSRAHVGAYVDMGDLEGMQALCGSERLDCVACSTETMAICPTASGNADVAKVLDVVSDRVHESGHVVCFLETELRTAVENRRRFHVNLFVDAEQGDAAGFGLVAAIRLVLRARRPMAAADALANAFLFASEVAQGQRFRLNEHQSIDLVANLRREFFELTSVRHNDGKVIDRRNLLRAGQNSEQW